MTITKNREVKYIPKSLKEELDEVRKKYKRKSFFNEKEERDYINEVNSIISELNSHKKEIMKTKKYALNFEFPIRKNDNKKK